MLNKIASYAIFAYLSSVVNRFEYKSLSFAGNTKKQCVSIRTGFLSCTQCAHETFHAPNHGTSFVSENISVFSHDKILRDDLKFRFSVVIFFWLCLAKYDVSVIETTSTKRKTPMAQRLEILTSTTKTWFYVPQNLVTQLIGVCTHARECSQL